MHTTKQYKHLFFDIDRTLWDFEANAKEAFYELFEEFELLNKISDIQKFISRYHIHNNQLWAFYRKGMVKKEFLRIERFNKTLKDFGITDFLLAQELGERYIQLAPTKTNVIPKAHETLSYLFLHNYKLHIITNGFKEVQMRKLNHCNLVKYFQKIITSDDVLHQKPHRSIFEYALKVNNAKKDESVMIGDDLETDIIGAQQFGMDQVYFNPGELIIPQHVKQPSFVIKRLDELKQIFP